VIKKGLLIVLIVTAFLDLWKEVQEWSLKRSQTVFQKALIESGISVD
jgi:hypothetical protein